MSNLIVKILLLLFSFILNSAPLAYAETFSDVEEGNGNYVAITYLHEQGVIEGYDDNTFKPNQKINRAEALKMLILASNLYTEEEIENISLTEAPFQDVSQDKWYAKYIHTAKEEGLINGYDDSLFRPDKTINLAETLKIYLNAYPDLDKPNDYAEYLFEDAPDSDWYFEYIATAAMHNLIYITDGNEVWPNQDMTRGYMAEIIYRMLRRNEVYEFGKATYYGKAVQGNGTASGETFDYNLPTAAHKYLPFGTIVKVTNLANGKSVDVKINDRGPYGYGRVIDLSSSAFDEIAWLGTGIIHVQVEIVSLP